MANLMRPPSTTNSQNLLPPPGPGFVPFTIDGVAALVEGGTASLCVGGEALSALLLSPAGPDAGAAAGAATTITTVAAAAAEEEEWACELCTLINAGQRRRCEACGSAKPPVPRSPRGGANRRSRSPPPPPLLSPVPPPPPPPPPGGGGDGEGQGPQAQAQAQLPPDGAVLGGPEGADAGGEDAKEDETAEEAKAGDPGV